MKVEKVITVMSSYGTQISLIFFFTFRGRVAKKATLQNCYSTENCIDAGTEYSTIILVFCLENNPVMPYDNTTHAIVHQANQS
jgi:hypothetical protein